jgi:Transglutaminase-like superfamily
VNKIGGLRELSWPERGTLLSAAFALPITALGLRILGFTRLRGLLARELSSEKKPSPEPKSLTDQARTMARMVRLASDHGIFRGNCLERSLTLWWLLGRHGIETDLRIGVRRALGQFEAHAWVELDGIALNDSNDVGQRYSPFDWAQVPANVKFQ